MNQQRIALVTGANRGLGLEISRQLAAGGMTVVTAAREPKRAEEAAAGLPGGRGMPLRLDVREATWGDFARFLTDQGNDCDGHLCVDTSKPEAHLVNNGDVWEPEPGYRDHPAVHVTWHGAEAYCRWRFKRLGLLPEEAHLIWDPVKPQIMDKALEMGINFF